MSDALALSVALSVALLVALCCLCHANWTLLAAHQGCGQPRLFHCGVPHGLSCVWQQMWCACVSLCLGRSDRHVSRLHLRVCVNMPIRLWPQALLTTSPTGGVFCRMTQHTSSHILHTSKWSLHLATRDQQSTRSHHKNFSRKHAGLCYPVGCSAAATTSHPLGSGQLFACYRASCMHPHVPAHGCKGVSLAAAAVFHSLDSPWLAVWDDNSCGTYSCYLLLVGMVWFAGYTWCAYLSTTWIRSIQALHAPAPPVLTCCILCKTPDTRLVPTCMPHFGRCWVVMWQAQAPHAVDCSNLHAWRRSSAPLSKPPAVTMALLP
jgi:hypothetical protein